MAKNQKHSIKPRFWTAFLVIFLAVFSIFTIASTSIDSAYAVETSTASDGSITITTNSTTNSTSNTTTNTTSDTSDTSTTCADESDAIGWLVCPSTGVISKAIDGIYSVIHEFLVIDPLPSESSSPIRIIWSYVRDITNILFVIFLLIVIYSQITGIGLNNYGIKRVLPKIILAAILMNLSYYICQISVDISNIIGNSLRGFMESIQEGIMADGATIQYNISWTDLSEVFLGTASTSALGIVASGGIVSAFWAFVPLLIGAIVSVFIGLVTIALRQAVVMLLAMISPLAFVCYLLPNTEIWFKKWKNLLFSMIIFFPAFSFLYGASQLAGWAIISTSESAFGIIIGLAVQVYPLFASWSLMKMSGTILGSLNSALHKLSTKPLATLNRTAASNQAYHRAKYLGEKPHGISQATLQRINDRAAQRASDTKRYTDLANLRGTAYSTRVVDENGHITRHAEEMEAVNTEALKYQTAIARNANDSEKGLSQITRANISEAQMDRLNALDSNIIKASDSYKYELSRGAEIAYRNAIGFNERTQDAINAHMDSLHAGDPNYQTHKMLDRISALERYNNLADIYEGNTEDIHFAAADAAQIYAAQTGSVQKKFETYFNLTAPTQDVMHRLKEITRLSNSTAHIDEIIAGLRTLNMRGDTDLVKNIIDETLLDVTTGKNKVHLGTYASQSLANFLMFDVKNSDPFLRRFGKYINLETAHVYNEKDYSKRRHNDELTFDEYITGDYIDYDETGKEYVAHNHRTAKILLEGTSFKDIERTGYANMIHSITKACTDKNGHVDHLKSEQLQNDILNAVLANLIGDSLSYLSGSEQITSFAQFITGIKRDKNGNYVENFLDLDTSSPDFQSRSPEEQAELLRHKREYYKKRADLFITSHVPSQMGRFKSDIFAASRQMYRNLAEGNLTDADRSAYLALDHLTASDLSDSELAKYNSCATDADRANFLSKTIQSRKETFLDEHGAKKYFKEAVRPKTYEYLQKMYRRGYLSDAKAPISAYLDLDKDPLPSDATNSTNHDDNNAGPAPLSPDEPATPTSDNNAFLGDAVISVNEIYREYNTPAHRHSIHEFLSDVLDVVESYNLDPEIILKIDSLSRSLSTITDVSVLYSEIINILNN